MTFKPSFETILFDTLGQITYPGLQFLVGTTGTGYYLQISCSGGRCNVTGESMAWKGRKWALSPWMTRSEIVTTALKAVLTAQEHEARECFKYRGQAIFGPHLDVDALVGICEEGRLDERPEPPGGTI